MLRTLITCCLAAAGLGLIAVGVQRWFDTQEVRDVADSFIAAIRDGEREQALKMLNPEQRSRVEQRAPHEDDALWRPDSGFSYRIHHVDIEGEKAAVKLWIEKEGFILQPVLHLSRSETELWQIDRIDNLQPDLQWQDAQREKSQADGERLAQELSKALKSKPSASVDRVRLPEPPE